MIFLFKIIEKASSACQISVFTCNQLTTMLFSLAALAGALIKRDSVEPLIISVVPCVMKKSYPDF